MQNKNDWQWVKIKVYPRDRETIENAYGYGSFANLAQWMVEELAERIRNEKLTPPKGGTSQQDE